MRSRSRSRRPAGLVLSGLDLASYIKQRHYQEVKGLDAAPKLVDIHASSDPATESYLAVKSHYGQDIGVEVEIRRPEPTTAAVTSLVKQLNADQSVQGIILQLPLAAGIDTDAVVEMIDPIKDVDGLGPATTFDPATPTGILWLLAGYGIAIKDQTVVIVGQGRLVGRPLARMMADSGARVVTCDINTTDLRRETLKADILVSAAGQKNLIEADMVRDGAVVVDAAGDVDPALLQNPTLKITPATGGVGPMTVAALFDNLLRAVREQQK